MALSPNMKTAIGDIAGGVLSGIFGDDASASPFDDDLSRIYANLGTAGDRGIQGIDQLFSQLLGTTDQYSKQSAIADAQGLVQNIFQQYAITDLPQIYQAENSSGGYNATTSQLLADNAFATTTVKAADTVMDAIKSYRGLQQSDFTTLAQLISSIPAVSPPSGGGTQKGGGIGGLIGGLAGDIIGGLF